MNVQYRIRPTRSLLDANPEKLERVLKKIKNIKEYTLYDDRVSDATFITLVAKLEKCSESVLKELKIGLKKLRHISVFLVDDLGDETLFDTISYRDFVKFIKAKKSQ